ncbi:cell envelope biogenesis protein OmpA [Peteryoungia ipomoeae]|uniref:Cell envelope biogenesis protein OmpA n=1 Tax=Peteryoungia ipomoeae TaxID=1210932 RepID=A0A4S8P5S5_9HYPH|nr:cell envelope biogenesis protein OmpA [Peteryoungia ipomoeae]THV24671.1 cell envelope biogenesis protein OmpA [Peteryoungia ipomoeae]
MFETAFALGLTQFARSLSFPERLSHRPVRNAALEPWRLRNTSFDALYYDVKALTAEEAFYVSDCLASEGMIMIVPPSGHGMLTLCESVEEFRLRGGRDVHAMAVAGIGGSAIGAAAFARNVADALGAPVAAVVSGYGLGDIVNEAIGGAFLFGWMGHVRGNLEAIDDAVGRPKVGAYNRRATDPATTTRRTGLDSDTVLSLLEDTQLNFSFIAGHSRGNRVIADALYGLKRNDAARLAALAETCRIVTFGGRIKMPEIFADVIDVVGEFDWFGELNSRPKIPTDIKVPFCGHSTNTDMPGSLQVKRILNGILADTRLKEQSDQTLAPEPEASFASSPAAEDIIADPAETAPTALQAAEPPLPETDLMPAAADTSEELKLDATEDRSVVADDEPAIAETLPEESISDVPAASALVAAGDDAADTGVVPADTDLNQEQVPEPMASANPAPTTKRPQAPLPAGRANGKQVKRRR